MSNIGKSLKGFCDGYFGRDSYFNRRIEGEGCDWIVTRSPEDFVELATFKDSNKKQEMLDKWEKESKFKEQNLI